EELGPEERKAVMHKASLSFQTGRGLALPAVGAALEAAASLGGRQLIQALLGRAGFAGLGIIGAALGAAWFAYDLAGPARRVPRPVVLTVSLARQVLRNSALAEAFAG